MNRNTPALYLNSDEFLETYENVNKEFMTVLGSDNFPLELKSDIDSVLKDVSMGKNLVDMYPKILTEIPISSSCFQDKCVQYEEHFTPHRKLRQTMLEMQNKLNALDTSKNGYKKTLGKLTKINSDISTIKDIIDKLTTNKRARDEDSYLIQASFFLPQEVSFVINNIVNNASDYNKSDYIHIVISELKTILWGKSVEKDELDRNFNATEHMIKDAVLKVVQQKKLVDVYQKEVEESGMSFEESEAIYYVLYFASEAEKQLVTMGRLDTGTYGVIKQLPNGIRKKVLGNVEFIREKLQKRESGGDYITIKYRDELIPKRTPDGKIEGEDIKDFICVDMIDILSKKVNNNV